MNTFELKPSFYKMNRILKLILCLQMLLIVMRIAIRNQTTFFLSDCLGECMMGLTYIQKNYCLALASMFYIFTLIYLNAIILCGYLEFDLPFFIEPYESFTIMIIVSSVVYFIESIALYQVYKEYKAIIYDVNQLE